VQESLHEGLRLEMAGLNANKQRVTVTDLGFERSLDIRYDVVRGCGRSIALNGNAVFSNQKLGVVPCYETWKLRLEVVVQLGILGAAFR